MNVIQKVTLKNLLANRRRTIVTIIGVILSVSMVTAVFVSVPSFFEVQRNHEIAREGMWHALWFDMSKEEVEALRNEENTSRMSVSQDLGSGMLEGQAIYFIGADGTNFDLSATQLLEGRYPENTNEIAITQDIVQLVEKEYQVGDEISVHRGKFIDPQTKEEASYRIYYDCEFQEEETKTYTITGILSQRYDAADINMYQIYRNSVYTVLDPEHKNQRFDVTLEVKDTRALEKQVSQMHDEYLENGTGMMKDVRLHTALLALSLDSTFVSGIMPLILFVLLIILIGSVTVIYSSFRMSLSQRSRYLGMLASVGATKKQKRSSVFFEAFVIGIISIPLGILAGLLGMYITFASISPMLRNAMELEADLHLVVSIPALIFIVVFSCLILFLSSIGPARRASQIGPIEAIRQNKDYKLSKKAVRTNKWTKRIFKIEGELALKNIKRHPSRYRSTLVSLIISIVLFISAFFFTNAMKGTSNEMLSNYPYDLLVQRSGDIVEETKEEDIKNFREQIEKIKTLPFAEFKEMSVEYGIIETMDLYDKRILTEEEKEMQMYDPNQRDYIFPHFVEDQYYEELLKHYKIEDTGYGGIFLNVCEGYDEEFNPVRKQKYDLTELDAITTYNVVKEKEGNSIPVQGVVNQIHSEDDALIENDATLILPMKYLEEFQRQTEETQKYWINGSYNYDDAKEKEVYEGCEELKQEGYNITNYSQLAKRDQQMSIIVNVFVYGFIALLSLVCITNVFNTITTSVALRKNEFAMLKSMGITPKGFQRMLMYESMFYSLKAIVYGNIIGIGIYAIFRLLLQDMIDRVTLSPLFAFLIVDVAIIILLWGIAKYNQRSLKNESIVETIRKENI